MRTRVRAARTELLFLLLLQSLFQLDPTPENYHEEHDNDYINDSEDSLPVKRARLSEALIDDLSEDDDQGASLSFSLLFSTLPTSL